MTVACNHSEYGHDAKDALADYLNANGIVATNANTGGNCMVVEVYRHGANGAGDDYIAILDSDEYGDDGTPCGTFTVIRAEVSSGEQIALIDTAMPAADVLAYLRGWLGYANALETIVRDTIAADPARYAAVQSWTALHDVCDANELLQDADTASGLGDVFEPWAPEYIALTTNAIAVVESRVWGVAAVAR